MPHSPMKLFCLWVIAGNTDWIISSVYFQWKFFFDMFFLIIRLFVFIFFIDIISDKKEITDNLNAGRQFLSVTFTDRVCFLRAQNKSIDKTVNGRVPIIICIDPLENHHRKGHYEGIINIRHHGESVSSMHLRSHNKKNTGMRY